jgi:hypothetical protein
VVMIEHAEHLSPACIRCGVVGKHLPPRGLCRCRRNDSPCRRND